jgi:hypothetical protein
MELSITSHTGDAPILLCWVFTNFSTTAAQPVTLQADVPCFLLLSWLGQQLNRITTMILMEQPFAIVAPYHTQKKVWTNTSAFCTTNRNDISEVNFRERVITSRCTTVLVVLL